MMGEITQVTCWVSLLVISLILGVCFAFYRRNNNLLRQRVKKESEINSRLQQQNRLLEKANGDSTALVEKNAVQQQKLASILDSTVDAIITITADDAIDSFNKAAETMFAYSASAIVGENIKMLMPEPYSSEHDGYLANYHRTGDPKIIGKGREVIGKRMDGSEFAIYLSVSEVVDSEPKLFTGIIQDITAWKKADIKLQATLAELTQKQAELEQEEQIARHVFENITATNNNAIAGVEFWCQPMGTFGGDMMLSTVLPSGCIRIILCDFTGHGLPAALGAVPVSSIHSAMAKKGLPLEVLMNELNNKLNELLPTGIFCCIVGLDLDATRTHAHIWNAGLPEVLLVNQSGSITRRIASNHLPLGVVTYDQDEVHCQDITLEQGDTIYVLSDGLSEAENEAGDMFGQQRFEQLLMNETDERGRLIDIRNNVTNFVGKAAATDDVSLIEIKTLVTAD